MGDDGKPCEILLVEDTWSDARLTLEALKESRFETRIQVVTDGEQALAYLRREGKYANVSRPDLIVLDLNLPKVDGREVLLTVKTDAVLRRIPVVILTSSRAEEDVVRSYDLYANCYITKPGTFAEYATVARSIEDFWLRISELPGRAAQWLHGASE